MARRRALAAVALAVAMVTAGCGFILGTESLAFSASPATVGEDALSETGYEEARVTEQVLNESFTVADQTREVRVTNQLAQYERQADLGPLGSRRAGVFVVFASPEIEVASQTFNPIAGMSERQLLGRFGSEYQGLSVGGLVENRTRTVLGQSTVVSRYEGSAQLEGNEIEVYIHATKLRHEGDFVVALGVYPQQLEGEGARMSTLFEGIEHDGE